MGMQEDASRATGRALGASDVARMVVGEHVGGDGSVRSDERVPFLLELQRSEALTAIAAELAALRLRSLARYGEPWARELMDEAPGPESRAEALRRTARGAVEDWLEVRGE